MAVALLPGIRHRLVDEVCRALETSAISWLGQYRYATLGLKVAGFSFRLKAVDAALAAERGARLAAAYLKVMETAPKKPDFEHLDSVLFDC